MTVQKPPIVQSATLNPFDLVESSTAPGVVKIPVPICLFKIKAATSNIVRFDLGTDALFSSQSPRSGLRDLSLEGSESVRGLPLSTSGTFATCTPAAVLTTPVEVAVICEEESIECFPVLGPGLFRPRDVSSPGADRERIEDAFARGTREIRSNSWPSGVVKWLL